MIKNDHSDIIWVKLIKEVFKFRKDLFIGFVYISPINSNVYRNSDINSGTLLDSVRQDISDFSQVGDTLLMGEIIHLLDRTETNIIFIWSGKVILGEAKPSPNITLSDQINMILGRGPVL